MKLSIFSSAIVLSLVSAAPAPAGVPTLEIVASLPNQQVTGVAVSKHGRIFVNFPNWSDDHTVSVAEIVNGKIVPFPNHEWNSDGPPDKRFVCVQSVYVDDSD